MPSSLCRTPPLLHSMLSKSIHTTFAHNLWQTTGQYRRILPRLGTARHDTITFTISFYIMTVVSNEPLLSFPMWFSNNIKTNVVDLSDDSLCNKFQKFAIQIQIQEYTRNMKSCTLEPIWCRSGCSCCCSTRAYCVFVRIFYANSIPNANVNVPFVFQLSLIEFELFTFSPHVKAIWIHKIFR